MLRRNASARNNSPPPNYLRRNLLTNSVGWLATRFAKLTTRKTEIKGRENVPQNEPFLLISNHFGGNAEQWSQFAEFGDRHIHPTADRLANFEMTGFAGKTFNLLLKAVQALPIDASIRESDREQFLKTGEKLGANAMKFREEILQNQPPQNKTFFKHALMVLGERREPLILYPEGLLLYEHKKGVEVVEGSAVNPQKPAMKQGYSGAEFIARMYERKTSSPLKILPVASLDSEFTDSGQPMMQILPPLTLADYKTAKQSGATTAANFTDFVMMRIAAALPPEFRGYYANFIDEQVTQDAAFGRGKD